MIELTNRDARRFLLAKQGLLGAHRFIGKEGALAYVRQTGCIQFDPVDVCGRNAELTIFSRVKGFRKQMLEELLYSDRALVDYADKELSVFPAEDWPHFAPYREKSRARGAEFPGIPDLERQAISHIRENGPASSDTLPIKGKVFWHSTMHWSGNWHGQSDAARSVLEQLYTDGTLVSHHKEGARKVYDLAERHLPRRLLNAENPCPDRESWLAWRVLRRVGAVGMLWNRRSDAFLGIDMTTEERNVSFARLLAEEKIVPVSVAGIRSQLYVRSDDPPLLEQVRAGETDAKKRLEFLAPLDPFLWDRKLIEAVFGFHYSWEIYTPREKRKYGYYVLPMLYGETFAGRIEAAADRKNRVLTVKNIWFENGVKQTKALSAAVARTVLRLAEFNECERITEEKT